MATALYRVASWVRHRLTARHTGGHGVHSPYLFELVRMVLADKNVFYKWETIETIRQKMLQDEREVELVDYGSLGNRISDSRDRVSKRKVRDIAKKSLANKKYAQMLARLVNWMGNDRSLTILELGTSLGVTTAYLAAVDSRNTVTTYEGCPAVAEIAEANWQLIGLENITCHVGKIDAQQLQSDLQQVDIAFIDANHTYAGTREYFNVLINKMHAKSVMVIDDIHYNREMEQAWCEICADERVKSTVDLYQMGLVFVDPDYWCKHYIVRL